MKITLKEQLNRSLLDIPDDTETSWFGNRNDGVSKKKEKPWYLSPIMNNYPRGC